MFLQVREKCGIALVKGIDKFVVDDIDFTGSAVPAPSQNTDHGSAVLTVGRNQGSIGAFIATGFSREARGEGQKAGGAHGPVGGSS